jgi:hypothetical protein
MPNVYSSLVIYGPDGDLIRAVRVEDIINEEEFEAIPAGAAARRRGYVKLDRDTEISSAEEGQVVLKLRGHETQRAEVDGPQRADDEHEHEADHADEVGLQRRPKVWQPAPPRNRDFLDRAVSNLVRPFSDSARLMIGSHK